MESFLTSGALFEVLSVLVIVVLFVWRMPSKEDVQKNDDKLDALRKDMNAGFQRVDERFEKQDAKIEALRHDMTAGFQRVDERFEKQDAKIDELRRETKADFQRVDERFEAQRIEFKADLQRVEDRAAEANVFHARSVELLDAIRRELEDRRERL